MSDFIAETRETLEAIAGEIVAWEADPADRARLDAIFRFVHTVKGSCGFLDLPRLERLSHAAEDALAEVREERRRADAPLVSAVLAVIDRIGELTDAIESGESLPDGADQPLIDALERGAEVTAAPLVAQPSRVVARSIRVPVELLDRMMASVSELVMARNELARRLRGVAEVSEDAAFERLSATIGELRDTVTRTRMARIDHLYAALPRLVRDLATELGKPVALATDGGDVELDREMIEMIRDPLTHMVRNAIDHGIEPEAARRAAGKPAAGKLAISARQAGNQIRIEIADDGAGIDEERLVEKAIAAGGLAAEAGARLSQAARLELIFTPGLSTVGQVTAISGRGVGMDVVRANVERIGGRVEVESVRGRGTRLILHVPLTLTIIPALTVSAGGQSFALPRPAIEEIVRIGRGEITAARVGGARIVSIRDRRLPVVELAALLGLAGNDDAPLVVVLKPAGGTRFALAVDGVHDHEELVVKPAAPAIMACGLYAGATLPDDNRPMLLLDPASVAAAGGIRGNDVAEPSPDAIGARAASTEEVPSLLFEALDGVTRAVRLALVERIEEVPVGAASRVAGRLRLAHEGTLTTLVADAALPEDGRLRVLRLSDGVRRVALAISRVIDIAALTPSLAPAASAGPVSGATLLDGRPIELVDAHHLFASAGAPNMAAARPLVLIVDGAGDAGWSREVLRPMLEDAGYRVAETRTDADADVVLVAGDAAPPDGARAPVVRLRGNGADGGIDRYDRGALIAALAGARRA